MRPGNARGAARSEPLTTARGTGPGGLGWLLAGQRATAAERQRSVELPNLWVRQIEGFLASVPVRSGQDRVLHTEVIREHLVVDPDTGTLSGLLDFECAMTGDRACEFVAAGLFVSREIRACSAES